jgi:hypothetical protein
MVITFRILIYIFLEFVKLIELALGQIVGIVEDERCTSLLAILKSKLHNMLLTHLPLIVHMLA